MTISPLFSPSHTLSVESDVTLTGLPGVGNPINVAQPAGQGYLGIQFYRDGVAILGATSAPYIQVPDDIPAPDAPPITITAKLLGITVLSNGFANTNPSEAPALKRVAQLLGSPMVGRPLSVVRAEFSGSPAPVAVLNTYADGVLVASGAAYTPLAADLDKQFHVEDVGSNFRGVTSSVSAALRCVAALPAPVLLEAWDSLAGVTFAANSYGSLDTTGQLQGAGRVRMAGTGNGVNTTLTASKTLAAVNPALLGVIAYCASKTAASATSGPILTLQRSGVGGQVGWSDAGAKFRPGNRFVSCSIDEMPTIKALAAGSLTIVPKIAQVAPYVIPADGAVDAMYSNAAGRPTVVLTDDDFTAAAVANLVPLLDARSMAGTFYVPTGLVGMPNRGTWDDARRMYASGHDIGCNTQLDVSLTSFPSTAAAVADVVGSRDAIIGNGMPGAAADMALSNGVWTDEILAALMAAGITSARSTEPQEIYTRFGFGDQIMTVPSYSVTGSVTVASAVARVELAKTRGATQVFHTHEISTTPTGIGWTVEKMTQFLDYLVVERDAGRIDILTMSQLRARDGKAPLPA